VRNSASQIFKWQILPPVPVSRRDAKRRALRRRVV
jgi:hypothetical protein